MDDLFELVKAMSASEKRYFKRFAKQHSEDGQPKYIILFDAYDSLTEFDPVLLKSRIEDEKILKFFRQQKKYLKGRILDCLRVYRGARTINGKLFRLLEEREIFNELGLYKQGEKRLENAKQIALQFDKFSVLIQILSLERKRFLESNLSLSKNARLMERKRVDKELQEAVKSQEILAKYHQSYLTILGIYRKENRLPEMDHPDNVVLEEILQSEPFSDRSLANSFQALHLYFLSLSTIEQLRGNDQKAADYYEELIQMWNERPDRANVQKKQYMLLISNYLNVLHKLGQYDLFENFLEKIRAFSSDNFDDQAEHFQNIAQLDLLYYMNRGIYSQSEEQEYFFKELQTRIETGIERYQRKINPARLLVLYYNLMILNFMKGDVRMANQWLLKIEQSEFAKKVRKEIIDFCKVIQLIFFYDMELYDLIVPFYRNNKRFLERKDRLNDFYLLSLQSLYKLSGVVNKEAIKDVLREMERGLLLEAQSDGYENIVGGKEILLWIQHKLQGKPLLQLAIENNS